MAQLNDLIVTGNSRFINKTYTSTADVGCVTASSAAGATEHSAGTTGQALVSDGDSVYWGDPQHAGTTDEAQHATSAAALDDTEFIEDNEPYLFRKAPSEAGDRVYEDAIVGGSVAWNQLMDKSKLAAQTGSPVTFTPNEDGSVTVVVEEDLTSEVNKYFTVNTGASYIKIPANHKYVLYSNTTRIGNAAFRNGYVGANYGWNAVRSAGNSDLTIYLGMQFPSDTPAGTYKITPQITDLTLMFGSTIADYIYTLEQSEAGSGIAWLKSQGFFTKDYYAYNVGSIKSVQTSAKKVVGFNQWDEEWENGNIDDNTGVNSGTSSSYFRSKNYIPCFPNTQYYWYSSDRASNFRQYYYDKNKNYLGYTGTAWNGVKTSMENAYYMRFRVSGSHIENEKICINLHWDGERDGEYEAYTEHTYPLDSDLELRGIPKLVDSKIKYDGDTYASDGSVTRKYGIVDLGSLTYTKATGFTTKDCFYASINSLPSYPKNISSSTVPNAISARFLPTYQNASAWDINTFVFTIGAGVLPASSLGFIVTLNTYQDASAFKTAMDGVYLVYELATPTTESADPYQNPQIVSNWGTEEFVDIRDVPVPVGHDSRYPKTDNYKLANIPAPPGGAGDYIVHTDEYGESIYQPASDIKVNYAGTADLSKRRIFIEGTQTTGTTTGLWTGDASEYFQSSADLTDGQEITYWLPLPTTGNATLNLKFGDGTSSGAVNCYYGGTTRLTTHYGQGQAIHLTYRKGVKIPSTGSTTYTGWWADANYYSDSNTVSSLRGDYTYLVAGTNVGVQSNSLIARDANGKYSSFTSNSTTAVSKLANRTDYFDISKIFYYSSSAAAGGNMASASLYWAMANINSRYTINASNLTARKPLYLKFDANESTVSSITGATCYKLGGTANDDYWSQTLPTSADGMIYVEISRGVRDYRVDLAEDQHYYQFTDKLHEYDSWSTKLAEHSEFTDGTIVYKETVTDNTNDGKLAFLEFTNTGVRKWNFPSTTGSTYISDKTSPCICRYNNGEMIYVDAGLVDVTLMQNIELTPNKMVYLNISSYNIYDDISASWGISASPFTQTVTASDQMVLGIAVDSSHFYLLPDNKINDKKGRSGHAYAHNAYKAERLSNNTQIGGGTSAVYFTNLGVPAPIDIAAVTVNNATNASNVTVTQTTSKNKTYLVGSPGSSTTTVGLNLSKTIGFTSSSNAEALEFSCPNDKIFSFKKSISGNNIDVGWDWGNGDGAGMAFRSKDLDTSYNPGAFILFARKDTTTACQLIGLTNGALTWTGRRVVTANNGSSVGSQAQPVYIDANGHAQGCTTAQMFVGTAQYVKTSSTNGYYMDSYGSLIHSSTVADNSWCIKNNSGTRKFDFYFESGNVNFYGDAIKFGTSAHTINTKKSIAAGSNCYVTTATGIATTGECSFAFGYECTAVGDCSWAEGLATRANPYSHAEGESTNATGDTSHAEGCETLAVGDYSHSEGYKTTAWDRSCHAEGYSTQSTARYSHAEGWATLASGKGAHAEGYDTTASGDYSHAEGDACLASTACAHAGGIGTIANAQYQTAIGKYNATVADALFIVGKGTGMADANRSNAMYVTTAGNINCVSVTQTSDERLKENIQPLTTADKSILDVLEPKQFTLKEDEKHQLHYGFIAQDVEQQINALGFPTSSHSLIDIADNEQAYYSLNYTELIPLLVQRVKDLEARIAILEKNK